MKPNDSTKPEKEIAAWFKSLRKHTWNLTQKELAELACIPLGTLRHFEQTGQISLTTLLQIADRLHVLHIFEAIARGEEPYTVEKIQKEKAIARLQDKQSMMDGKITPMELRDKNSRTPNKPSRWKMHGSKKWLDAPATKPDLEMTV